MIECLKEVHSLGLIHRDVNPNNYCYERVFPKICGNDKCEKDIIADGTDACSCGKRGKDMSIREINKYKDHPKMVGYLTKTPIMIIDFGFSRSMNDSNFPKTDIPDTLGTLRYKSISSHDGSQGWASDLESLCYSLVYLKTGKLPWMKRFLKTNISVKTWNSIDNIVLRALK